MTASRKRLSLLPWILLDTAQIPGGGALRLKRRGGEFSIMLGDNELMNSRLSGSEEALATLSLAKIGQRPAPKILIGGLGMGFTLRAALGSARRRGAGRGGRTGPRRRRLGARADGRGLSPAASTIRA